MPSVGLTAMLVCKYLRRCYLLGIPCRRRYVDSVAVTLKIWRLADYILQFVLILLLCMWMDFEGCD